MALGCATGTALVDGFKYGIDGIYLPKIAFFFVFITLLLLPIPNRWLFKERCVAQSDAANEGI